MKKIITRGLLVMVTAILLSMIGYFLTIRCNRGSVLSFQQLDATTTSQAPLRASVRIRFEIPPDDVFEYISSAVTMPEWLPGLNSLSYDHSTSVSTGVLGEGSQRTMMFGDQAEIEEIVQFARPNLIAYQIRRGVPLRNHLAVMTVVESGEGDSIFTWYQSFDLKITSVFGWLMPFMVRSFLKEAQINLIQQLEGTALEQDTCP